MRSELQIALLNFPPDLACVAHGSGFIFQQTSFLSSNQLRGNKRWVSTRHKSASSISRLLNSKGTDNCPVEKKKKVRAVTLAVFVPQTEKVYTAFLGNYWVGNKSQQKLIFFSRFAAESLCLTPLAMSPKCFATRCQLHNPRLCPKSQWRTVLNLIALLQVIYDQL